ncbi:MAG TPA: alpha-amylase [Flavisolibacter sp.]|jgi:alpha-amylase|nr:alpha-amylase [Flavisolibacter sp.]
MTNGTMIQLFHWYTPEDGSWWNYTKEQAAYLSSLGITAAWLPPASKATAGGYSVGYDVYDLYDLGEFDQKGIVRTRYGTKEELLGAVKALKASGIQVIADIVLNHKGGGDETETITAVKVNPENRTEVISDPFEIEAFTRFTFPGRKEQYSDFKWDHQCFSGVDFDKRTGETAIYNILQEWGDDWEEMIDDEKGNYDYLMFNDVEFRNPAVREELLRWGLWFYETIGFDGVRLDAVKHISPRFYNEWLVQLRKLTGRELFAVGEYWAPGNLELLLRYLEATEGNMSLFDSALHHNLHRASRQGNNFDLSSILGDSLVQAVPAKAVTVVENHDTQPLQALEAPVEHWFKPLAYALILLRQEGYPCVFYPDLYGAHYRDTGSDGQEYEIFLNKVAELETLLKARRDHAYGIQRDYFDHPNCIGWTREGDEDHTGCAVVLSNGEAGNKFMEVGKRYAGKAFVDLLQHQQAVVKIDENGWAEFLVNPGSVSVWVEKQEVKNDRKASEKKRAR